MQKRYVTYLFAVLAMFFFSIVPSAANYSNPENDLVLSSCPAPAPTGLNVVSVTPTSITIAWFATMGTYYKIDVYDLTIGFGFAPIYTSSSPATITNLIPGHTYQITISASYCPNGPYGPPSVPLYVTTPGIIIDMIVEFQSPCTLPDQKAVTAGMSADICVANTNQLAQYEYENGVIGKVVYQNRTVHFGMAWLQSPQEFHVGKLGNQGYNSSLGFEFVEPKDSFGNPIIPPPYVICQYNGTDIFRVDMTVQSTNTYIAYATLSFLQNCNFAYCGEDCGNLRPDGGDAEPTEYDLSQAGDRGFSQDMLAAPVPNPFNESAAVRYTLEAASSVEIGLYDAFGRLVQTVQSKEMLPEGEHTATISGAGLANGVYFLRVQTGSEYKTYTLVKHE